MRGEDLIFLPDIRRHSDWSIYNRWRFNYLICTLLNMGGNIIRGICLLLFGSHVSFHYLVLFFLSSINSQGLYSYVPWWALKSREDLFLLSKFCSPPCEVCLPLWFSEIIHFLLCFRNAVTILGLHERGFALIIFRFSSLVMLQCITFSSPLEFIYVCNCLLPRR